MKKFLLQLIKTPKTGKPLKSVLFESKIDPHSEEESIMEGILFSKDSNCAYPIINGIPVMLDSAFPKWFLEKHKEKITKDKNLSGIDIREGNNDTWSFSNEWDEHFDAENQRTWGYTVKERVQQFHLETQVEKNWLKGKLILDAGCGNGTLSEEISKLGGNVVGLDYSSSVFQAEKNRISPSVHYVRGDLQKPSFEEKSFDLAFSIGVLHHTPNTYKTFTEVAKLVKPEGRFYLWLYRRPEGFLRRHIKYPVFDLAREIISRLAPNTQDMLVQKYASFVKMTHSLKNDPTEIPLSEYVVSAYDDFTPRWRHYHTPLEVSKWFFDNGFSAPVLTHWDNPYGFGLVAVKKPQNATPGINFGESIKLWDKNKTIIG